MDLNESGLPPAFDFNATTLQVVENADVGTYVGLFSSFGGDANASVNYDLIQDAAGAFEFYRTATEVYVRGCFELRRILQWTLCVKASNEANETMSNFFQVSVWI